MCSVPYDFHDFRLFSLAAPACAAQVDVCPEKWLRKVEVTRCGSNLVKIADQTMLSSLRPCQVA